MKLGIYGSYFFRVASHAEAWIETMWGKSSRMGTVVASHAEAWIETTACSTACSTGSVASHAEAWIETTASFRGSRTELCRLPRGGVD